jgi:ProP effector
MSPSENPTDLPEGSPAPEADGSTAPVQAAPADVDVSLATEVADATEATDADAAVAEAADASSADAAPAEAGAQPAGQTPAQTAARLAELFPGLFKGQPKPLKLRIQVDIQERAPGEFSKTALSAFFRRYTGATSYLIAVSRGKQRFDLDGQPAGELTDEHRQVALDELTRRRAKQNERREQEEGERRQRLALLRDFENTKLTEANFCALKGITVEALPALLAQAREELKNMPAPQERRDGRHDGRGDFRGGRGDGRGDSRGDGRGDGQRRDGPRRDAGAGPGRDGQRGAPRDGAPRDGAPRDSRGPGRPDARGPGGPRRDGGRPQGAQGPRGPGAGGPGPRQGQGGRPPRADQAPAAASAQAANAATEAPASAAPEASKPDTQA